MSRTTKQRITWPVVLAFFWQNLGSATPIDALCAHHLAEIKRVHRSASGTGNETDRILDEIQAALAAELERVRWVRSQHGDFPNAPPTVESWHGGMFYFIASVLKANELETPGENGIGAGRRRLDAVRAALHDGRATVYYTNFHPISSSDSLNVLPSEAVRPEVPPPPPPPHQPGPRRTLRDRLRTLVRVLVPATAFILVPATLITSAVHLYQRKVQIDERHRADERKMKGDFVDEVLGAKMGASNLGEGLGRRLDDEVLYFQLRRIPIQGAHFHKDDIEKLSNLPIGEARTALRHKVIEGARSQRISDQIAELATNPSSKDLSAEEKQKYLAISAPRDNVTRFLAVLTLTIAIFYSALAFCALVHDLKSFQITRPISDFFLQRLGLEESLHPAATTTPKTPTIPTPPTPADLPSTLRRFATWLSSVQQRNSLPRGWAHFGMSMPNGVHIDYLVNYTDPHNTLTVQTLVWTGPLDFVEPGTSRREVLARAVTGRAAPPAEVQFDLLGRWRELVERLEEHLQLARVETNAIRYLVEQIAALRPSLDDLVTLEKRSLKATTIAEVMELVEVWIRELRSRGEATPH